MNVHAYIMILVVTRVQPFKVARRYFIGFSILQVVGGVEGQMPSRPSTTGVDIIPYSQLHSEVSLSICCI